MVLKTFNLDKELYEEFSKHCKSEGISMSKKVDNFIRGELENLKEPRKVRKKTGGTEDKHPLEKYC